MASAGKSLESVFKEFCAFGAGASGGVPTMDNSKFAKLSRDLKLLDKKLTATDIDIFFNKVKSKTERKITFAQFEDALKLMADKKYPGDADGVKKLTAIITGGKGPQVHGVTKTTDDKFVERMTDTSKYTGSHKERFDESGKGKGLAGRDSLVKGEGYVGGASSNASYVQGYKHEGTYDKKVGKK